MEGVGGRCVWWVSPPEAASSEPAAEVRSARVIAAIVCGSFALWAESDSRVCISCVSVVVNSTCVLLVRLGLDEKRIGWIA